LEEYIASLPPDDDELEAGEHDPRDDPNNDPSGATGAVDLDATNEREEGR
jgi:hypothetical protein